MMQDGEDLMPYLDLLLEYYNRIDPEVQFKAWRGSWGWKMGVDNEFISVRMYYGDRWGKDLFTTFQRRGSAKQILLHQVFRHIDTVRNPEMENHLDSLMRSPEGGISGLIKIGALSIAVYYPQLVRGDFSFLIPPK